MNSIYSNRNFQVCPPTSNVLKMNDMNALTPSVRNFHDLVAIEDVVLFDALLPDYDKLLGCNYYQTYKKKGKLYLKLLDKF